MFPEEQSQQSDEPIASDLSPEGRRGQRRPGRGRRGRGGRRKEPQARLGDRPVTGADAPPEREEFRSPAAVIASEEPVFEELPSGSSSEFDEPDEEAVSDQSPRSSQPSQRAEPASLQAAIDHVNHVIDSLRNALEEMEEVLETVEALERQTGAEEREIESLRRALRQLHRPREGGLNPHRHSR
jgi:hypothetical protein